MNLWRLTLNKETAQISGPPQRLTSGSTMETGGNLTSDGHLIFAAAEKNYNIWSLELQANEGRATGEMKKLTDRSTPGGASFAFGRRPVSDLRLHPDGKQGCMGPRSAHGQGDSTRGHWPVGRTSPNFS